MYDTTEPPRPPGCGNEARYVQPPAPRYEFRGREWPKWWGWLHLVSAMLCAVGLAGTIVSGLPWAIALAAGMILFGLAVRGPS
jgi:hypothetical protein